MAIRTSRVRAVLVAGALAGALALSAIVPAVAGGGTRAPQGVAFVTLATTLSGAAEAPGPGDPDGAGVAQVNLTKAGAVCFAIAVDGITLPAAAAHIHSAPVGVPGPVVVTLAPPQAFGSGVAGASAGCVTNVPNALITAIASQPDQYYVNVHNADFPAGAVRGQLAAA